MKKSHRIIIFIGATICVAMLVVCGAIWLFQDNILFHPFQDEQAYEQVKASGEFEEIILESENDQLTGWLKKENETAPVLIYFGGRQQCASDMFQFITEKDHWPYYEGYSFLCIDYPGYGQSDGVPGDKAMFQMADRVHEYVQELQEANGSDGVVVFGYSIGTGVTTYYAFQYPVDGLILLAPYRDGVSLFNKQANIFHGPLDGLVKNRFNSIGFAENIPLAPLLIMSKADIYMDYDGALELVEAFPQEPQTMIFEDVDHDYFFRETEMLDAVHSYLQNSLT